MENQTNNNQSKKERDEEIIHKEVVKQCGGKRFESEVSWGFCRSNIYLSNHGLKYISKIGGLKIIKVLKLTD